MVRLFDIVKSCIVIVSDIEKALALFDCARRNNVDNVGDRVRARVAKI
jgi:hypothetical protein